MVCVRNEERECNRYLFLGCIYEGWVLLFSCKIYKVIVGRVWLDVLLEGYLLKVW